MALSKIADFVDPPSKEYICPICLDVIQEPYLTTCCGNHFCQTCIQEVEKTKNPRCPLCNETPFKSFINKHFLRQLNQLKVYCSNKAKGCEWIGEYGKVGEHLSMSTKEKGDCQYVLIKCPASSCSKEIFRGKFKDHVDNRCDYRKFLCKHCGLQSTYLKITSGHYDLCVNFPVFCPNSCSKVQYARSKLKDHLAMCPEQEVACPFSEMGCKEKFKRRLLQRHIESSVLEHQMEICKEVQSIKIDKERLEAENKALKIELASHKKDIAKHYQPKEDQSSSWIKGLLLASEKLKKTNWALYLSKMSEIASTLQNGPPFLISLPINHFLMARSMPKREQFICSYIFGQGNERICLRAIFYPRNKLIVGLSVVLDEQKTTFYPYKGMAKIVLLNNFCDSGHQVKYYRPAQEEIGEEKPRIPMSPFDKSLRPPMGYVDNPENMVTFNYELQAYTVFFEVSFIETS